MSELVTAVNIHVLHGFIHIAQYAISLRSENHYQSLVTESVSGVGIENISIKISPFNVFINIDL